MDIATVTGPVPEEQLGLTLPHEHIFINLVREYRADGLLNNHALLLAELLAFKEIGGRTIIDLTTAELTRGAAPDPLGVVDGRGRPISEDEGTGGRSSANVEALKEISREAGVQVVIGTGHYRHPYLDTPWVDRHAIDDIAAEMIGDLRMGVRGTGCRAGLIGEVGSDAWYVSASEERVLRAAARAQLETGVAVSTHSARWPVGLPQLDVLESEGVRPNRVIIGHCDSVNIPAYHEQLARRGVFVQFDTIRGRSAYDTELRVEMVVRLIEAGYTDQILLSHDVCLRSHLAAYGGCGFTFIAKEFLGQLARRGMSSADLQAITVDNPARVLSGSL